MRATGAKLVRATIAKTGQRIGYIALPQAKLDEMKAKVA